VPVPVELISHVHQNLLEKQLDHCVAAVCFFVQVVCESVFGLCLIVLCCVVCPCSCYVRSGM